MINSGIYNYINVLDKAADASWTRNDVITNNISNADTPNYKRKDISFQRYLQAELAGTNTTTLNDRIKDVELSSLNATAYTDMANLSYRLDGNNVDIDTENVELASNQIMYQALINSISNDFDMIKKAME
ncbi:flagellar basal body rod protein FlgB [Lachnospiraceae bacterium HCP1S3_C3]